MSDSRYFWAVREVGTNCYLPAVRGRQTITAPTPLHEAVPRLHNTRAGAAQALQCWKMGEWKISLQYRYSSPDEGGLAVPEPKHVPARDSVELEVVPMYLSVREEK